MNSDIEHLFESLLQLDENAEKVDLLIRLSILENNLDHEKSLQFAQQAYKLATNLSYTKGISRSCHQLGNCLVSSGDNESALQHYRRAKALADNLKDVKQSIESGLAVGSIFYKSEKWQNALSYFLECYNLADTSVFDTLKATVSANTGLVYYRMGEYVKALEYHLKALKIYEKTENKAGIASALNNIGAVYTSLKNYDEAFSSYKRSLEIKIETNDKLGQASPLHNLGDILLATGQFEKAKTYFLKSYELCNEAKDIRNSSQAMNSLSNACIRLNELDDAYEYCMRAFEMRKELNDKLGEAESLHTLGQILLKKNNFNEALKSFEQSLHLAEEIKAKPSIYNVYLSLYSLYKDKKDYENALNNYIKYVSIEKEIFNEEKRMRLLELEEIHKIEEAQKEAEIYRLKNVQLADLNKRLKEVNEEKNDMMRIVAHDLKNPLTGILNFSKRIASDFDKMENEQVINFAKEINITSNRMFEMITKMLDISAIESGRTTIELTKINITVPTQRIFFDYRTHAELKNINLTYESESEEVFALIDRKAYMQVLDNLVSNAIKYSPQGKNIFIRVKSDDDSAIIEVQDEGPGFTENDKTKLFTKFSRLSAQPTGGEHSTGLGLSIVKTLIDRMNGYIFLDSVSGKGSKFILKFPSH